MKVNKLTILDYVKVVDESNEYFGRVGQWTDYDMFSEECIVYFDKLSKYYNPVHDDDCARFKKEQLKRSWKYELEKL